jgi:hypothetical protein
VFSGELDVFLVLNGFKKEAVLVEDDPGPVSAGKDHGTAVTDVFFLDCAKSSEICVMQYLIPLL